MLLDLNNKYYKAVYSNSDLYGYPSSGRWHRDEPILFFASHIMYWKSMHRGISGEWYTVTVIGAKIGSAMTSRCYNVSSSGLSVQNALIPVFEKNNISLTLTDDYGIEADFTDISGVLMKVRELYQAPMQEDNELTMIYGDKTALVDSIMNCTTSMSQLGGMYASRIQLAAQTIRKPSVIDGARIVPGAIRLIVNAKHLTRFENTIQKIQSSTIEI